MREIKFRAWWVEKNKFLWNVQEFYDTLADLKHGNFKVIGNIHEK